MSLFTQNTDISNETIAIAAKILNETGLSGGSPGGGENAGDNSTTGLVTPKVKPKVKGKGPLNQTNEDGEKCEKCGKLLSEHINDDITLTEEQLLAEDFNNIHHFLTGGLKYSHTTNKLGHDVYTRNDHEDGNPVKHIVRLSHNKDLKGHDTEEWNHVKTTSKFLSKDGKMEDNSEHTETHKFGHNKLRSHMLKVHGFAKAKAMKEEVLDEGKTHKDDKYSNAKKWMEKRSKEKKAQKGLKDKHFGEEILNEKFGKCGADGEDDTEDSKGDNEADRHLVVQMRKAADYKPDASTKAPMHANVLFRDNKSHPVSQSDANKFLTRHDKGTQEQKANLVRVAEKSHKHFQAALGKGPMPAHYDATVVTPNIHNPAKGAWERHKNAKKKFERFDRLTARLDKQSK